MLFLRSTLALAALMTATACASPPPPVLDTQALVMAAMETAPAGSQGDSADDPAVWPHPVDAAKSVILGTNKQRGLVVYGLDGALKQDLPIGRLNNVDLRAFPEQPHDLAVASNDEANAISVFRIDRATGTVSHAGDVVTGKLEPYGICAGQKDGAAMAGVTYKDGTAEVWSLAMTAGAPSGTRIGSVKFATQLEGCVFDEANDTLFIGEELKGIWSVKLSDLSVPATLVDAVGSAAGLVADTEGLTLWRGKDGDGWLIASAQAHDRFVIYDRKAPHAPAGSFSVGENPALGIDKVTHTDGLDAHSGALPGYPRGVVIVQDDGNPAREQDQNFKLASWADIEAGLGLRTIPAE